MNKKPTYLVPAGRTLVSLITEHDMVVSAYQRFGTFEPETLARWCQLASDAGLVIDVGAYTGIYTIAAALSGCSSVMAFEPNTEVHRRLVENIQGNLLDGPGNSKVQAYRVALGRLNEWAFLHLRPETPLTSAGRLTTFAGGNKDPAYQPTRCIFFDSFSVQRKLAAVKIDVEGAEIDVINGMRETLARHRPVVFAEALTETATVSLVDTMAELGYPRRLAETLDCRNMMFRPS